MATLIYDGDCTFCKKWVDWLLDQSDPKPKIFTFQNRPQEFQRIPTREMERAVHFVDDDGTIYKGASVFFRVLEMRPQSSGLHTLYKRSRAFRWITDIFYRLVADNRQLAAWVTYICWGDRVPVVRFQRIRRLFLGVLGFCYLSAFVSLGMQVKGLIGENGVLPAGSFLDAVAQQVGSLRFIVLPTLGWLGAGNHALVGFCVAGALFSVALMANLATRFSALACWVLYLSLTLLGNIFLGYQWEELLLEAGFLALFLAPGGMWPKLSRVADPRPTVIFLFRWLVFRLMFSSGLAKIASGDASWKNLTALNYHFETQPLPTWIAWYAAKLPDIVLKSMTLTTLFIEAIVPFLFFLPRRFRIIGFWFQFALQIAIILTGNYCYFNILALGLCLFLLDDAYLEKLFSLKNKIPLPKLRRASFLEFSKRAIVGVVALILILVGGTYVKNIVTQGGGEWDKFVSPLMTWTQRYSMVGSYGLFVNMTTERDEIVIEGSRDGVQWLPYEFPFKPGDVSVRPRFVAPYQPRLDWQAWFAAFGDFDSQKWLQNLIFRLLQGQQDVTALFKSNPFASDPPRYIRVMLYEYKFSDAQIRRTTGNWWTRELKGPYSSVLSLQN